MTRALVLLTLISSTALAQDYRFPLERPGANATQPYITAYRDLASGGGLEDWNCGNNTYNGHRGTDIGIGGFAVMDAGSRWIVAAADGEVSYANDGCYDRCTSGNCDCGGGFGNYVRITHADGKRTYYGHMMNGSVAVSVGDQVTCGQRLGKVASSGSSTGPHLHFEPRYSDNTSDDPFSGPCGGNISFWVGQGAYNDLPDELCEGGMEPPPPPPPVEGTIKGVLWDRSITDAPGDGGNVRVAGATLEIAGVATVAARSGDAYWSFTLAPGNYRVTASAAGYQSASRDVTVTGGQDVWASIGLLPNAPAVPEITYGEADPNEQAVMETTPVIRQPELMLEEATSEELDGGCACLYFRTGSVPGSALLLVFLALLRVASRRDTKAATSARAE
jgi:murein DD-endopeptidase MepM/ murein hydrolase activator NlpD